MTIATPEWSTITEEVACPLCDYQLRGLADPRATVFASQFIMLILFCTLTSHALFYWLMLRT
jgi:hypothetical protein